MLLLVLHLVAPYGWAIWILKILSALLHFVATDEIQYNAKPLDFSKNNPRDGKFVLSIAHLVSQPTSTFSLPENVCYQVVFTIHSFQLTTLLNAAPIILIIF